MPSLRIACAFQLITFFSCFSARAQQPAQPTAASASSPATTQPPSSAKITNVRVVEMTKLGLDDDVIIARIKHGSCEFQLSDADLLALKQGGVSSKVVAAMLDAALRAGLSEGKLQRQLDNTRADSGTADYAERR
jgi:hypothetical protein